MVTAHLLGPTLYEPPNSSLGNELFVCMAALAHGWKTQQDVVFLESEIQSHHKNTIFKNITTSNNIVESSLNIYHEPGFTYTPVPNLNNICLRGYFQSPKYFEDYTTKLQDMFGVGRFDKLSMMTDCNPDKKVLGALHVRRGDYLSMPDFHNVLDIDYYKKAVKEFPEVEHWIICSDDINWCKENFDFIPSKYFSEGRQDYEDIWLMSIAQYHIIANSTFSWWSAWLSKEKDKKVIYPAQWFGPAINHDTSDLFPSTWRSI
tara:strand:+ start:3871 stop:4653 length:783 start_codon:yes stop_codon:yes gene_type:complete